MRGDRVFLRKCEKEACWELVEFHSEGERLLAKFYCGCMNKPGHLAYMALEEVQASGKV